MNDQSPPSDACIGSTAQYNHTQSESGTQLLLPAAKQKTYCCGAGLDPPLFKEETDNMYPLFNVIPPANFDNHLIGGLTELKSLPPPTKKMIQNLPLLSDCTSETTHMKTIVYEGGFGGGGAAFESSGQKYLGGGGGFSGGGSKMLSPKIMGGGGGGSFHSSKKGQIKHEFSKFGKCTIKLL